MTTTEVGHKVDIRVQETDSNSYAQHPHTSQEHTVSLTVDQGGDDRDENSFREMELEQLFIKVINLQQLFSPVTITKYICASPPFIINGQDGYPGLDQKT